MTDDRTIRITPLDSAGNPKGKPFVVPAGTFKLGRPAIVTDPPPKHVEFDCTLHDINPDLLAILTGDPMTVPKPSDPAEVAYNEARATLRGVDLENQMYAAAELLQLISERIAGIRREERERAGNLETYPELASTDWEWSAADLKGWIGEHRKRTEQRSRLYDIVIAAAAINGPTRTTQRDVDVIVAALLEAGVTITEK